MIMKSLQLFRPDLPKLVLGDPATRANRLLNWKIAVEQTLAPTEPHMKAWWQCCYAQARKAYTQFMHANIHDREAIIPVEIMPTERGNR